MGGQIFISYRREDGAWVAGRLFDILSEHFGSDHVFIDVDNLDAGIDFVEAINESVGSCDVLIAVIGERWLTSSGKEGRRRLDNSEDFVRLEIATAGILIEKAAAQFGRWGRRRRKSLYLTKREKSYARALGDCTSTKITPSAGKEY